MILGIGTDLIAVDRFSPETTEDAFLERTFTQVELADCRQHEDPSECLAGKFAAKEALVKALGLGMRQGLWFSQIEVTHDEHGAPQIEATGPTASELEARGVQRIHLTLSHSAGLALAVVVLEAVNS